MKVAEVDGLGLVVDRTEFPKLHMSCTILPVEHFGTQAGYIAKEIKGTAMDAQSRDNVKPF
jgi:hypothetical protein